jgi:alanine racemase
MGGDGYSVDDWAHAANTINYGNSDTIASRVPRIYQQNSLEAVGGVVCVA